ncbi:MrpH family fimbial adhesin [Pseudomonas sp. R32]|jgi:hypothetical protein|uniref:MrpH family fimbial adhesin n=1 Tax=Pseudomonas sp. R32 TaxID=1573704 RepID=UPI001331BA24|nr:hypothetical protein [Pseudomonas sp. R32]
MKIPFATKLRSALAAVLLCGAVVQAHAISIYPTKSEYEPGGVRYYFVVNDFGPVNMKSPCATYSAANGVCRIFLAATTRPDYYIPVGVYSTWDVPIRPGSNLLQLQKDLESKGFQIPLRGSVLVTDKTVFPNLCISFAAALVATNESVRASLFGPCAPVTAPPLRCEITGDTTIDHKNLADNVLDGATASTQLYVQCRGPASVTVSTSQTDIYGVRLKDDRSLYSKITVNAEDATKGINVPISQGVATPLTITSTLMSRGNVTPGAFLGSTIVTISPP